MITFTVNQVLDILKALDDASHVIADSLRKSLDVPLNWNTDNIKRRLGSIEVSTSILNENPLCMLELFKVFIPHITRPDYNPISDSTNIVYIGKSPLFEEVSEGMEIPIYQAIFHPDGHLSLEKVI